MGRKPPWTVTRWSELSRLRSAYVSFGCNRSARSSQDWGESQREARGRWRRRRWCCASCLSSPRFKPFKMCCYDRAAVISSRWRREADAAAALQSSLYSQQSTQSLVFSVFACSASALRQALKLRAASAGLGGSLSRCKSFYVLATLSAKWPRYPTCHHHFIN